MEDLISNEKLIKEKDVELELKDAELEQKDAEIARLKALLENQRK